MKISIVTAVYDRVDTIAQAVDSVAGQTWSTVEHIVIDGASADGTREWLENQRDRLSVLLSEPDNGIYDALNKGLSLATGDVIGLMHSDDFYANDRVLEKVAAVFDDPGVDGVYGDLDYVAKDEPSQIIRRWRSGAYAPSRLAWGWMPPHPPCFYATQSSGSGAGSTRAFR